MRIGIAAGEASGDVLGSGLIHSLKARETSIRVEGIAGSRMREAGCDVWVDSDKLAVMGLFEVLGHLPELLRIRSDVRTRWLRDPPDVFVGIDAPDFNLPLAARLRAEGIRTVQYVSPQVWAWRQGRIRKIAKAVDCVLCLLPFEKQFYDKHGVPAEFVGHPLADQVPMQIDQRAAREKLSVDGGQLLAVLPGSRRGEVLQLANAFAQTIAWLAKRRPNLGFVVPLAAPELGPLFEQALGRRAPGVGVQLIAGDAQTVMAAADAVLLASGTATLEALLLKKPMVVAYRFSKLTVALIETFRLMKIDHYSLPNLLAGTRLVPEYYQQDVRAEVLGPAVLEQLDDDVYRTQLVSEFDAIHRELRRDADRLAADAVLTVARG